MTPTRVIDAHHHLWDLGAGSYPGLSGPPEPKTDPLGKGLLQRNYLLSDYLADASGVPLVGSIHVEAGHDPSTPVAETQWLSLMTSESVLPVAIVARANLESADLPDVLDRHQQSGHVVGIRQMLDWQGGEQRPSRLLADPRWRAGLTQLGARGLSFDLQVVPSQLIEAADVASEHPDVTFVLNHGGYHVAGEAAAWREGLARIAREPNVMVKVSGYQVIDPDHREPGFGDFVRSCVNAFGPHRAMFASNFPYDGRSITMPALVDQVSTALTDLSPSETDDFWYGTAVRVYRLESESTTHQTIAAG